MELHSINCCLSPRIKLNKNIIFLDSNEIDKNTANAYFSYEK